MKKYWRWQHLFPNFSLVAAGFSVAVPIVTLAGPTSVNVTQHHNHDSRDGLFIDPAFTAAAATVNAGSMKRPSRESWL